MLGVGYNLKIPVIGLSKKVRKKMMNKYINADKLCEDLMTRWKIADKEKEKEIQSIMADVVVPIVVGQPSANVAEIVRCKDCEFYDEKRNGGLKEHGYCEIYKGYKKADGFCDIGARRETE